MEWIVKSFQQYPELAIFLTLGLGYWVGNLKLGKFNLGSVTGVLLAGVLVGQMHITISPNVKSVFFIMFLFAVGYGVTAILQSTAAGIGLAVAGVPFATILFPVVFWVYSKSGAAWGTIFLVWAIFCGTFDNFLRPLLIKRGADLPLLLIFAGVIGGLIAFGVIGLFIGPVVLAVAYTLLVDWVSAGDPSDQHGEPPSTLTEAKHNA
jgi:hypothetical protein